MNCNEENLFRLILEGYVISNISFEYLSLDTNIENGSEYHTIRVCYICNDFPYVEIINVPNYYEFTQIIREIRLKELGI